MKLNAFAQKLVSVRRALDGVVVSVLLSMAVSAIAAPPPGHPTPQQASEMLMPDKAPTAGELPREGKVKSSINANEFTYIEVVHGDRVEWIAAPLMTLKDGSTVRYEDGSVMKDFYSKLLKRTFSSVMFVGHVLVTVEP